jgi:hypothetical protein
MSAPSPSDSGYAASPSGASLLPPVRPGISDRHDVAVAVDLVMVHHKVTADHARDLLTAHAARCGLDLGQLASEVIDRGASIVSRRSTACP